MIRPLALACCAAIAFAAPPPAYAQQAQSGSARGGHAPAAAASPSAKLRRVFDLDEGREQAFNPLIQILRGREADPRSLASLFSDAADRQRLQSAQQSLALVSAFDPASLPEQDRISLDAFVWTKRQEIAALRPEVRRLTGVQPLTHFGGLHIEFPSIMARSGAVPYATEQDYRRALALLDAFPEVLDGAALRFREGMASGAVTPALTVRNMIAQIDGLLAQPVEQSPFTSPVTAFPGTVPANAQAELRGAFAATAKDRIYPAYRRLRDFLIDEYLPKARTSVGLTGLKGGPTLYRQLIEERTTLPLDPEQIHQLGLTEVARIQREMEAVKAQLGFTGPLRQFFDEVRTNPRYHPHAASELADGFARIGREVDAKIPEYFARVPSTLLRIETYPDYRARFEAGGSYSQGTPGGSSGVFYYNAYDLPSRFLTGMATLYLHEGAPGHHFQISLAQENESLPDFQRFGGNDAFVEGWALYAETLGFAMGLYDDPMQHWGTLDDEMLRAMRLVVDTGLHAKGWPRERAVEYMLANSGMGRSDAEAEVDRYIAIPAQALAYKIGALTIQRLRKQAEDELGPRFDLREFHEQVLGSGALPLPVLEAKVMRWIEAHRPPPRTRP